MITAGSHPRINNLFNFKHCERKDGTMQGKHQLAGSPVALCSDHHFQHQDRTYKFSAAQGEQGTLNFSEVSNYNLFSFSFFPFYFVLAGFKFLHLEYL